MVVHLSARIARLGLGGLCVESVDEVLSSHDVFVEWVRKDCSFGGNI